MVSANQDCAPTYGRRPSFFARARTRDKFSAPKFQSSVKYLRAPSAPRERLPQRFLRLLAQGPELLCEALGLGERARNRVSPIPPSPISERATTLPSDLSKARGEMAAHAPIVGFASIVKGPSLASKNALDSACPSDAFDISPLSRFHSNKIEHCSQECWN